MHGDIFVPLMYKMALLGNKQLPLYNIIGRDKIVALRQQIKSGEEVFVLKTDKDEIVPELINSQGKNALYIPYLNYSGIYDLRPKSGNPDDTAFQKIAFNYSRSESALKYFTGSDLESEFASHNIHYLNAVSNVAEKAIAETQIRNSLWKWFVMLTLVFLAIEVLLIRLYNPTVKTDTSQA